MAEPIGVAPPEPDTNVGLVRLLGGDSDYVALDPPVSGMGLYKLWSDAEIEAALSMADDSVPRAIAILYTQLAAHWNSSGATIKTDDLTYSVKDSVGSWLSLADYWRKVADDEDDRAINDYFDLVDVGVGDCWLRPEATPWPLCDHRGRCSCW